MPRSAPPAIELDPRRVVRWRLVRQRLDPPAPARAMERVATELVGIQAQVASSADLSLALRVRDGRSGAATRLLAERRLVRAWAMRGTLHLFAADDYPTIAAALPSREVWREALWLKYFGVTVREMETVIAAIGEILDDGRPRTRAELAEELTRRVGRKAGEGVRGSWGSFLKPAAFRGLLCQAAGEGSGVTFTRPDRWLRHWRTEDLETALRELIRRYLAAYGPATLGEICRWWGVTPKYLRARIESLADETTHVSVDGHRGLLLTKDVDAIERGAPIDGAVRLIGSFDPFTVGAGLRELLIPPAHLRRVSRTAGWISPVVLIGGRAAGVWTSERARNRLRVTVDPFGKLSTAERRAVGAEVERLGAIHGSDASLAFGPVFATAVPSGSADN
jgi:hypothetical protein